MKKAKLGILLGLVVGVLDVTPMIIQKMSWDANLSAFFHWLVVGYIISITRLNIKGWIKGLTISVLTLIPIAFLVWWNSFDAVIPMSISTVIFGSSLGWLIEKYGK